MNSSDDMLHTGLLARVWDGITPVHGSPGGQLSSPSGIPSTRHQVRISKPGPGLGIGLPLQIQGSRSLPRWPLPRVSALLHAYPGCGPSTAKPAWASGMGGEAPGSGECKRAGQQTWKGLAWRHPSRLPIPSHARANHRNIRLALPSKYIQNPTTSHHSQGQ